MLRFRYYLKQFLKLQLIFTIFIVFYLNIFPSTSLNRSFNLIDYDDHRRQSHLLDNECTFLWTEPLDSTLQKYLQYPKFQPCETTNANIFQRFAGTGEFLMRSSSTFSTSLQCKVDQLGGGLKPAAHTFYIRRSETFTAEVGIIFWINADNFIISCFSDSQKIYQKSFMGFEMIKNGSLFYEGQFVHPTTVSSQSYEIKTQNRSLEKYSVSMLVLDSTSRAQFYRNMKKSTELLLSIESVIFEAYNKVGDNSAINMIPILAGELDETKNLTEFDESGDINLEKILPSKRKLNPDKFNWIWNRLDADYVTMFNDDTMHTSRGLFHYPPENFEAGFGIKPAHFYFRPFYNQIYTLINNFWRKCFDGELMAEIFLDSWFRFERIFEKIPHFGFSFIASLTHDNPNNLRLLDDVLHKRIEYLHKNGHLNNTFLIIMGDHGNRVHPLNRYSFAGKIEERAPFLSVFAPPTFRVRQPEKFQMLKENSQKFISNFDLHQTLLEILRLPIDSNRGKSLFSQQDRSKSCQENNVIQNHCLCMVDAKYDMIIPRKKISSDRLQEVLRNYFEDQKLDSCFKVETITCKPPKKFEMPNNFVQVWARTKISEKEVKRRKKKKKSPIIYTDSLCSVTSILFERIQFKSRIRINQLLDDVKVIYHPMIINSRSATNCSFFSFPLDYCKCIEKI